MWPETRFFHSEGSDPYLAPLGVPGGQGRVFFHWSQFGAIGRVRFQEKIGGKKFYRLKSLSDSVHKLLYFFSIMHSVQKFKNSIL